jgi:hypothetical protein
VDVCLDDALRDCWKQWVAVVEGIAQGRPPQRLSEADYRALHRGLLNACRTRAGGHERQAQFQRLEELVEPWITPQALAATDAQTLQSLLLRSRQFERDLGWDPGGLNLWRWVAVLAVLGVAAALGLWLSRQQSGFSSLTSVGAALWMSIKTNSILSLTIGLPVVVLASVFLFTRFLRA